jgi:hypothetical protein
MKSGGQELFQEPRAESQEPLVRGAKSRSSGEPRVDPERKLRAKLKSGSRRLFQELPRGEPPREG